MPSSSYRWVRSLGSTPAGSCKFALRALALWLLRKRNRTIDLLPHLRSLDLNALADRAPEFAQSVQCCLHIVTTGCGRLGALKEITLSSQYLDSERARHGKDDWN